MRLRLGLRSTAQAVKLLAQGVLVVQRIVGRNPYCVPTGIAPEEPKNAVCCPYVIPLIDRRTTGLRAECHLPFLAVTVNRRFHFCTLTPQSMLVLASSRIPSSRSSSRFSSYFGYARRMLRTKCGQLGDTRMSAITPARCSRSLGCPTSSVSH